MEEGGKVKAGNPARPPPSAPPRPLRHGPHLLREDREDRRGHVRRGLQSPRPHHQEDRGAQEDSAGEVSVAAVLSAEEVLFAGGSSTWGVIFCLFLVI